MSDPCSHEGLAIGLSERKPFFIREIALGALRKTLQRTRKISMSAVHVDSRRLLFKVKPKIDVRTKAIRYVFEAKLIELVILIGVTVLEEVPFTLEDA